MEAPESRAIVDSVTQPRADIDDLEKMMDEMGIRRKVVCYERVPRELYCVLCTVYCVKV